MYFYILNWFLGILRTSQTDICKGTFSFLIGNKDNKFIEGFKQGWARVFKITVACVKNLN
jgi:hypothetical protein